MKDIFTVMKFTMKEMIKRKSFIISTIIILVFIVVGFNVPNIIKSIKGEDVKSNILISDNNDAFEGRLELLKQSLEDYEIQIEKTDFDKIKEKIENEDIESAIIIEKQDNNTLKIRYILKNMSYMANVPEELTSGLEAVYSNIQLEKIGLTDVQLQSIKPNFELSVEQTSEEQAKGNVLLMMLLSVVLFYAIYFCAYQVSSEVTTEKTSKIMETLVTSTSPRNIIWGKTLGIGLVGVGQVILIVGTAFICAKTFLDKELIESVLDMSNITVYLAIMTLVYFVLGYLEYSLLYALTGSTVSKPEDIQSANGPVAIIAVVGFYLSYFTMMNPTSELNKVASLVPISSPFCVPFRIMMGLAEPKDVILSIAILIITIFLIAKIAVKIYSSAILNYGTKLNFKDIVKMYKTKL